MAKAKISSERIRYDAARSEHDQTHIRSPLQRLHQYLACGGQGSRERDHSTYRLFKPYVHRFVHLDPPGLIRFEKIAKFGSRLSSGGLHHNPIDYDTSGHIFPKWDQQLSRHCQSLFF
jgi:hypothetical protein